ncbi:hypothetical protein [Occultella gossypii]|uniref:Uncharacterized protein n=1 Tax=Occultella gossypii TaxID=2800820 RepID=A0ABS7SDQ0_9MICO|nr:hypothetical protein [Occultella gossypii]MBZ2197396.1 hypothetical protein [Occultella gossypii]
MGGQWADRVAIRVVLDRVAEPPEAIAGCTEAFVRAFEARRGRTDWEVIDGPAWTGSAAELTEVVRSRPSTAATGEADPSDGYGYSLYRRLGPRAAMSVGVDVGGRFIGRRLPSQNVRANVINPPGVPVEPGLADALLESLIEAWRPLFANLSTYDINVLRRRGQWKIPAGYRVWLRDGTVSLTEVADGITLHPFAGGTMIRVPDHWAPEEIAARLVETYERNGVDVVPH